MSGAERGRTPRPAPFDVAQAAEAGPYFAASTFLPAPALVLVAPTSSPAPIYFTSTVTLMIFPVKALSPCL
jgi:hypothetical protein